MPNTEHKPTERVLNILELLGTTPSGLSLSDIAKHIGSPKTTVAPILHTMASRNFIAFHRDSSLYTIGIGAYLAGSSYYGEKSIMQFIKSEMEYAVNETNEICQFGIRSDNSVLYIAKVPYALYPASGNVCPSTVLPLVKPCCTSSPLKR